MTASKLFIYQVFEKNEIFKNNIKIFINSITHSNDIDYLILVSGDSTIQYPQYENIRYFYFNNQGLDYGSYQKLFSFYKIHYKYKYIVFLNSSVLGPFSNDKNNWLNSFVNLLDDEVKLVGSSINDCGHKPSNKDKILEQHQELCVPHVQSYFFIMQRSTLECLISKNLFKEVYLERERIINEFEIKMSRLILENDWNIGSILKEQIGDYKNLKFTCNPSSKFGDPHYKNGFFYRTLLPDELVFIKPERNLYNYSRLVKMMILVDPKTKTTISRSSRIKLTFILNLNSSLLLLKEKIIKWIL